MDKSVTIHHLEVQFDVEGDEDRKQFGKLFKEFIGVWSREYERAKCDEQASARERKLGNGSSGGSY